MKKTVISLCLAVAVFFVSAVTLCVRTLRAPQSVALVGGKAFTIVLDAGHGGMDGGVVGVATKNKESDINLSITMCLKETLLDRGFSVVLTRKTPEGLYDALGKGFKKRDMQKRKEIIESAKPSLVISVHQNFYPSSYTRGAQVFYSSQNPEAKRLANLLQTQLNALYEEDGVKARKEKTGAFYMLTCTPYPTVIVECGFLSNPKDDKLVNDATWQKKLAERIASGVLSYFSA